MNRLFVEQLNIIDFSYLDAERGLVGETWMLDVELSGKLNPQGMLLDFSTLKPLIKNLVDDAVDHKLLCPLESPELIISERQQGFTVKLALAGGGHVVYSGPAQGLGFIGSEEINPETLGAHLLALIEPLMPDNITSTLVTLRPLITDDAFFHYSHGLSSHSGNCQRIAHGHRSCIQIFLNDERNSHLEDEWANAWTDIYLADKRHLTSEEDFAGIPHCRFSYQAEQGDFALSLPKNALCLLPNETTIEYIAQHIAAQIRQQHPDAKTVRVRVYEGLYKGAMADA
ncbi:MAG: 6-carboxytetrahydropterin synthase [gamma proteobacterium symbiont of Bathyaustriella thionipta]|nr:6-carboxytetrahydropterin synthase [gamma proteobacterium symbiont of Bathyaustriella thionipta]